MLSQRIQKYVSDYISRNRNAQDGFRRTVRKLFQKYLYVSPERRFGKISALKKAGRLHEYHLELRDAAIEFARHCLPGEAVKAASALPGEYVNAHLANCLKIVTNPDGDAFGCVSVEVSTRCNLRCPLCVQTSAMEEEYPNLGRLMDFETFQIIWDQIKGRTKNLCLTGKGESFLNPDIYKIIDYSAPTPLTLDTNGNIPIEAERIMDKNLRELYFSIDGIDQRTYEKYRVGGNFEKVVANFRALVETKKRLKAKSPELVFKYLVFRHNEMYIDQARQLAESLGADRFKVDICLIPAPLSEERINRFYPLGFHDDIGVTCFDLDTQLKVFDSGHNSPYCPQPFSGFYVQVDGGLAPCCVLSSFEPKFNFLEKRPFEEIWFEPNYVKLRRIMLEDKNVLPVCAKCAGARSQAHFPEFLEGTDVAYPPPPHTPCLQQGNLIKTEDLRVKAVDDFLPNELAYFQRIGKLEIQ